MTGPSMGAAEKRLIATARSDAENMSPITPPEFCSSVSVRKYYRKRCKDLQRSAQGVRTVNGAEPKKAARKRHTSKVSMFLARAHGMLKMANKA